MFLASSYDTSLILKDIYLLENITYNTLLKLRYIATYLQYNANYLQYFTNWLYTLHITLPIYNTLRCLLTTNMTSIRY